MITQQCELDFRSLLKRTTFVFIAWTGTTLSASLVAQQTQPADEGGEDLRAVVRVSWELIDAFADDQVIARVPFETEISNGTVTGYVESKADLTILPQKVHTEDRVSDSVFLVRAEGNAQGTFSASSGCLRISGPVSIPFWAECMVSFDGRKFQTGEAAVDARVSTYFRTITTRRNGPIGRAATRVASPFIRRQTSSTEQESSPVARQYVSNFIDRYTTEMVTQLNQVTPVERSLFKLYPELKDWRIRVSTEGAYLQAHYAPPESPSVALPKEPHKDAAIEIWIRTTAPEAKFLERIGKWDQTQELLKKYLPGEESEAGRLTSETNVKSFGPWFAILIGQLRTRDGRN